MSDSRQGIFSLLPESAFSQLSVQTFLQFLFAQPPVCAVSRSQLSVSFQCRPSYSFCSHSPPCVLSPGVSFQSAFSADLLTVSVRTAPRVCCLPESAFSQLSVQTFLQFLFAQPPRVCCLPESAFSQLSVQTFLQFLFAQPPVCAVSRSQLSVSFQCRPSYSFYSHSLPCVLSPGVSFQSAFSADLLTVSVRTAPRVCCLPESAFSQLSVQTFLQFLFAQPPGVSFQSAFSADLLTVSIRTAPRVCCLPESAFSQLSVQTFLQFLFAQPPVCAVSRSQLSVSFQCRPSYSFYSHSPPCVLSPGVSFQCRPSYSFYLHSPTCVLSHTSTVNVYSDVKNRKH